ncbi:MAG: SLBB domain-containing protein [Bacteroidota bacterium]|nr:SLBB domain-containing protein [Bacteroidota bacterium]
MILQGRCPKIDILWKGRSYLLPVLFGIAVLSVNASGQLLESYLQQKKAEKEEPNPFLQGSVPMRLNQLDKYYRRAFSGQQERQGFRIGMNTETSGTRTTASLRQRIEAGAVLDGAVNADEYVMGPMDIVSVNIWGDMSSAFETMVTPEGSVIIPTVGEISIRGLTLAQAKQAVSGEIRKKYGKLDGTITLLAPRTFHVHVTGVVTAPGTYEVSPFDRVDKAVFLATLPEGEEQKAKKAKSTGVEEEGFVSFTVPPPPKEPVMSMRNILVFRGADTLHADILRYYATGDVRFNPRLRDGDIVHVSVERLEGNTVSVDGGVNLPGSFEYLPGDSVGLLLRIAQGFKETAVVDSVIIARFRPSDSTWELTRLDGRLVQSGTLDMPLERNDRVFVPERKFPRTVHAVAVRGEVATNGYIPIVENVTTLSEVIARAGGFTPRASIAEGMVLRRNPNLDLDPLVQIPDYVRLRDMRLTDLDRERREYFTYEQAIQRNTVSVDFIRLFIEGDKTADVLLQDGDEIVIPASGNSVFVYGQVRIPGHVPFVAGEDESYYIERAGGYTEAATRGKTRVIKAGTKNWVDEGSGPLGPGDMIFVPRQIDRDFNYYFTLARDFLTVAVSVVTIYLLVRQIR